MYRSNIFSDAIQLIIEEDIHKKEYLLKFPTDENNNVILHYSLKEWVGVNITNWLNTTGKKASFKEIIKRFNQYCIEASKLRV